MAANVCFMSINNSRFVSFGIANSYLVKVLKVLKYSNISGQLFNLSFTITEESKNK